MRDGGCCNPANTRNPVQSCLLYSEKAYFSTGTDSFFANKLYVFNQNINLLCLSNQSWIGERRRASLPWSKYCPYSLHKLQYSIFKLVGLARAWLSSPRSALHRKTSYTHSLLFCYSLLLLFPLDTHACMRFQRQRRYFIVSIYGPEDSACPHCGTVYVLPAVTPEAKVAELALNILAAEVADVVVKFWYPWTQLASSHCRVPDACLPSSRNIYRSRQHLKTLIWSEDRDLASSSKPQIKWLQNRLRTSLRPCRGGRV